MKIYTKTGDKGTTSLYDGTRIKKSALRVQCYGTLDELSAFMGLVKTTTNNEEIKEMINKIQVKIFSISAELAVLNEKKIKDKTSEEDILSIEKNIDNLLLNINLPRKFLISGNSELDARLHICRTVCRRAERLLIQLNSKEKINENLIKYINRLSDLFYALIVNINKG